MHRSPYGASGSVVNKPPRQGLAVASSSAGVSGYSQQKRTKTKVLGDKVSQEEEKEKYKQTTEHHIRLLEKDHSGTTITVNQNDDR